MASVTPLSSLQVTRRLVPGWYAIPNCSIQQRPLLIYHGAFAPSASADDMESHLGRVGVVAPQWRFTMYDVTHFHTTAHEVLCISQGRARLCFGGDENPGRFEPVVGRGDVLIVPAGLGHRLVDDLDGGFQMVGSYPPGRPWDMCYGVPGEEASVDAIRSLPWFERDPIYGDDGPAVEMLQA
ncbi:hypothetical protein HIM_04748 [Hirsutella minnesotensis 3608]|uniref:Cupin type-1 domain-containing protein n=1 Tax=Hirsutella minnesotensis 3608 TaxID=1043627 RepID=A0A0F8A5U2_9HYPO|nr:hypothetical protein HIM_04748 [Hirsutella minnesotensis 3608]